MQEGYLCPVNNKLSTDHAVDMSGISVRKGEFVERQMEDAFMQSVVSVTQDTVEQCIEHGRKSLVIFTSGVDHAERVVEELTKHHMVTEDEVGLVTEKTQAIFREATLKKFKAGAIRWLVNVNPLTEGFDAPRTDAVVMMRATMSPGLFAQAIGRGFRIDPSKHQCVILDYGGNIDRHGPINGPEFGKKKAGRGDGEISREAPSKKCPKCQFECYTNTVFCPQCNHMFEFEKSPLDISADTHNQVIAQSEWYTVEQADAYLHVSKKNGHPNDAHAIHTRRHEDDGRIRLR